MNDNNYDNLQDWFDEKELTCTKRGNNAEIQLQFCGFELILNPNGTYILNDTTGG